LIQASFKGDLVIVDLLLEAGADVNLKDRLHGRTALHYACKGNRSEVALELLNVPDINVELTDKYGDLSLHICAEHNVTLAVQAILELAANRSVDVINVQNDVDWTPLHRAVGSELESMAEILIEAGADPNLIKSGNDSALHMAANRGMNSTVRLLVRRGADVDVINEFGLTALTLASAKGYVGIVSTLMDAGADPHTQRLSDGFDALIFACSEGHSRVVETLLNYPRVNIESRTSKGSSPLIMCASSGAVEGVKLLLDRSADFDVVNDYGMTALMAAVDNNHTEASLLLLEKRVNPNQREKKRQWTALHMACLVGNRNISLALLANDKTNTSLRDSIVVTILKDNRTIVDSRDSKQRTPLSYCASSNNTQGVKALIAAGADLDALDIERATPVMRAALQGSLEAAMLLIEAGARTDFVATGRGRNTLHLACIGGSLPLVKKLLERVNWRLLSSFGESPIHLAAQFDHPHVVK
jgi:ankyrin repeat protein